MSILKRLSSVVSLASILGVSAIVAFPSQAAVLNGDFENPTDFASWSVIGDTTIQTGAFGSGSSRQALLTNANVSGLDDAINLNFSGIENPAPTGCGAVGCLEQFLGITPGALDPDPIFPQAVEGSAIAQTFTANIGETIQFDWNFLTNDTFNPDYAFAIINGSPITTLATTANATNISATPFPNETGFQTFNFLVPSTGSYTLQIGLVDVGDGESSSGLLIDNVTIAPVPFEFSPAVGLLALGALYGGDRLRRKLKSK